MIGSRKENSAFGLVRDRLFFFELSFLEPIVLSKNTFSGALIG